MKEIFKTFYYVIICMILLLSTTSLLFANEFWVSKSGNDSNGCTNKNSDACLTIQKAISLTRPGDTVSITSEIYTEDSYSSLYTSKCYWLDNDPASICINTSGTATNPIVIQAAPGNEGKVVIDSELKRIGIQMHNANYIHIKGLTLINNYISSGSRTASISLDANAQAYLKGNILARSDIDINLKRLSETKVVKIMSSDYNIFDSSFKIIADRYSKVVSARYYSDLPKWQAAQDVDLLTLGVSNPDQHSTKKLYTSLFVDVDKGDYSYLPGSAAIGFMKDGSNAGPYQYGNEVIGSTLGVVRPAAPSKFKVD